MRVFRHENGLEQRLAVADLIHGGVAVFNELASDVRVSVVYSDPPWNPGNEKYWRNYAGAEPPDDYANLLNAWGSCVVSCRPAHVFVEQSVNVKHRAMLLDAIARCAGWTLPLIEQWTVQYGSPKRPNLLIHFGREALTTNPEGLCGDTMTRTVFEGLRFAAGDFAADPCTGLGMTSRLAHDRGVGFVGTELNAARLDKTIARLLRRGYREVQA